MRAMVALLWLVTSLSLLCGCASNSLRISDFTSRSAYISFSAGDATTGIAVRSTDDGLEVCLRKGEQTLRISGVHQFRGTLQLDSADLELRDDRGETYALLVTHARISLSGRGHEFHRERARWPAGTVEVVDWVSASKPTRPNEGASSPPLAGTLRR